MNGTFAVERRLVWNRIPQDRRKIEMIQLFDNLKELIIAAEQIKRNLYSRQNLIWFGVLIACLALIGTLFHPAVPPLGPASYLWSGFHRIGE